MPRANLSPASDGPLPQRHRWRKRWPERGERQNDREQLMSIKDDPRIDEPVDETKIEIKPYTAPAGGWGSVRSLLKSFRREHNPVSGSAVLLKQNKPQGFACVSCAWAKPADPHVFEFCENGAKATTWEITPKRVTRQFFADHPVSELRAWNDHDLEEAGRL